MDGACGGADSGAAARQRAYCNGASVTVTRPFASAVRVVSGSAGKTRLRVAPTGWLVCKATRAVDGAREGKHARVAGRSHQHRTPAKRGLGRAQRRQIMDDAIEGVLFVELVAGPRARGAEQRGLLEVRR